MKRQQSLVGLLVERLPSYELRFRNGIRQSVIVEELKIEGYDVSLSNFKVSLHVARKKLVKEKLNNVTLGSNPAESDSKPIALVRNNKFNFNVPNKDELI